MSYESELQIIESEFTDKWTYTDIAYQNVNFNPSTADSWVRLNVLPASASQISMGSTPYFRYNGVVVVQVFTRPGTGGKGSMRLVDYVTTIFRAKNIGGIQFGVPVVAHVGSINGWNQVNVNCPYYREDS